MSEWVGGLRRGLAGKWMSDEATQGHPHTSNATWRWWKSVLSQGTPFAENILDENRCLTEERRLLAEMYAMEIGA